MGHYLQISDNPYFFLCIIHGLNAKRPIWDNNTKVPC